MSLLCKIFGHKIPVGYYKTLGSAYFELKVGPTDGIGRVHGRLFTKCPRCELNYQIGMIHVPLNVKP